MLVLSTTSLANSADAARTLDAPTVTYRKSPQTLRPELTPISADCDWLSIIVVGICTAGHVGSSPLAAGCAVSATTNAENR